MNDKTTSGGDERQYLDDAIAWHVRVSDPNATSADWEAFTGWLEASSEHGAAYDQVLAGDSDLDNLRANAANDEPISSERKSRWPLGAGLGVVASLFMAFLFWPSGNPALDIFQTNPGETRVVVLGPETRIKMNGDTVVATDPANPRFARLDRGEAMFFVRHDADKPFVVESGNYTLRDEGTAFNVKKLEESLSVSVSEGSVRFNPIQENKLIQSGRILTIKDGEAPTLSDIDPLTVGGWREGRLRYSEAPLSAVAADLTRISGTKITVDDALSDRRFSGVIVVEKDQTKMAGKLEQLLGVKAQDIKEGWLLTP